MSVAQIRAARRKIKLRYGNSGTRTVAESMAAEREKAKRMAASMGKGKK